MLVAVERKPTMAHGSYDGGGQCLLQLFFFFPVQRISLCCCFFFRLLLFGSSPFGLWWGWSCWWLLDGAVEVAGRWSCCGEATVALLLSMQRREPLFFSFFLFFCWSILPSQWRRYGSGGEEDQWWFSFFFPSSSVTFFPHGSSLFFCVFLSILPPVSIVSPSLFLFPPLTVSFPLLFFSFLLCSAGAVVMENGSGCWTKKMMSWRWRWQCWCGSLPSFILSSVVPLWFSLPFPFLFFFSSSFSGFYKPKNGMRCNVQHGNGM